MGLLGGQSAGARQDPLGPLQLHGHRHHHPTEPCDPTVPVDFTPLGAELPPTPSIRYVRRQPRKSSHFQNLEVLKCVLFSSPESPS